MHRRGVTMTDVLVAVVLVGLLSGYASAQIFFGRERARRTSCMANLRMITQGLFMYMNDNKGWLPVVKPSKAREAVKLAYYTGADAEGEKALDAVAENDVTAALYVVGKLYVRSPQVFLCPSATKDGKAPVGPDGKVLPMKAGNFRGEDQLSYSAWNPYVDEAAIKAGCPQRITKFKKASETPMVADMNPGGEALLKLASNSPAADMALGNSMNHAREGQCVGYLDGHVEWRTDPFAGVDKDNLYTAADVTEAQGEQPAKQKDPAASVAGDQPRCATDIVLLPRSGQKMEPAGK